MNNILLSYVTGCLIDNKSVLVQEMAWCHQAASHYLSQLEQLERLRSEDTPRRPMITHTIDQFILKPKSIPLTSSYRIPSQNKVKAEKLEKFAKNLNFTILL